MSDGRDRKSSRGARFWMQVRVHPQVPILLVALLLAFPAVRGGVGAAIWWWWGPTYRQFDFVMTEASPNATAPACARGSR